MAWDFSTRLDKLGTRMKELHDNSLTYTRINKATEVETDLTIENFTPGECEVSQTGQEYGIVITTEKAQTFIFDADDLSTLTPVVPIANDKITWDGNVFEIVSIDDKYYNYTTSSRERIRVHTKQVHA